MPTEVIRPKFDVKRGWPHGSAHDRTFQSVEDGGGSPLKIRQGTFVTVADNEACTPITVTTDAGEKPIWLIIEGNDESDSYAGDYLDKAVGIRGAFEVVLSETMYAAGSYNPGDQVTIIAGQVAVAVPTTNDPVPGMYVIKHDTVANELCLACTL